MRRAFRMSAVICVCAGTIAGQPAGTLHRHVTGLAVRLPATWTAQDDTGAVVLVPPGADTTEVYVAVTQTGYSSADESQFVEALSAGFMQRGVQVVAAGERETFTAGARPASRYTWEMVDPAAQKRYVLRLYRSSAGSRAFVIVAMGPADVVRSCDANLRQVLAGMDFATPEISAGAPLADATPLAQQWLAKLRGRVVKQFISGGGAAGQKVLSLASDGTYSFRSSVAIAADVPGVSASATGRKATARRWHIAERNGRAFLQLVDENGETQLLSLTVDSRNWYLNGEKAFAVDQ